MGKAMKSIDTIETERLLGRRPAPSDYAPLAAIVQDARVAAVLWPGALGGVRTERQTRERLYDYVRHWERHGFGPWLFFDRETDEPVAQAGLRRIVVVEREEVELLYAVASGRWGEGLATEIGHASVAAGFELLGLDSIAAFTLTSNAASRRVMEKTGFELERHFLRFGLPHVLYRLRRAEGAQGREG
jgi:ribosomal-protein-alanine N-acetyltransferase